MREALSLSLNRDGGVDALSLKGDLDLRISDAQFSTILVKLPPPAAANAAGKNDLQFKTHPNVDKAVWAQRGEIKLKEGKKGFPVGQGLGVLKWRLTGTDESIVPISSESLDDNKRKRRPFSRRETALITSLRSPSSFCDPKKKTVNCWPSADSGNLTVNLEYELENASLALHNVVISIPLAPGAEPSITDAPAHGEYAINDRTGRLEWTIDEVSERAGTASGSMEFECAGDDADACFPVAVDFVSQKGLCGVDVSLRRARLFSIRCSFSFSLTSLSPPLSLSPSLSLNPSLRFSPWST